VTTQRGQGVTFEANVIPDTKPPRVALVVRAAEGQELLSLNLDSDSLHSLISVLRVVAFERNTCQIEQEAG
jgi:hypothetical protein